MNLKYSLSLEVSSNKDNGDPLVDSNEQKFPSELKAKYRQRSFVTGTGVSEVSICY